MTKLIVITGATGSQGGGVANILLNTPGWKVRAITRNPNSDKAKSLVSRGAEVVQADFNNAESLKKAFQDAQAIFAVTNFWEQVFAGNSLDESGVIEEQQGMKLAEAAAQISTLEHYIWSTVPSAKKLTKGEVVCPHMDYKANVDERIRNELPELAKKTTFLVLGYYPSNMAFFPLFKPVELPDSHGKYIQLMPTPFDAKFPIAGDLNITPGTFVRQILAHSEKSKARYANASTDYLSFGEVLRLWSEVTGRATVYIHVGAKEFEELWGVMGREVADQLKFGEMIPDYLADCDVVSTEDLGITDLEAFGCKKAFESLKELL